MIRKLPLYAERALGELQNTRAYVATSYEEQFRGENPVTCKAGCANCCYYPILITIGEGILLYRHLSQKGKLTAVLKKKLAEHADLVGFMDGAVWMMSRIPCPLLDEKNRCAGYEGRPLTCRTTFSAGDPEHCDPQAFDPGEMGDRKVLQFVAVFESNLLKKHGMSTLRVPLSQAVLFAERILSQEVGLADVERMAFKEFFRT